MHPSSPPRARSHHRPASLPIGGCTVALTLLALTGCAEGDTDTSMVATGQTASELAYRNAVNEPPPGFTPVFELSHDYPDVMPPCSDPLRHPWLEVEVDFEAETPRWEEGGWAEYMAEIMDFVRFGQDPQLTDEAGFQTRVDGADRWFHVPWMAYAPKSGREFVHGLTNELSVRLDVLVGGDGRGSGMHHLPPAQGGVSGTTGPVYETWAFGAYNDCGGYALGRAFGADGRPVMTEVDGQQRVQGLPFAEGTLVFKLLFSTATPDSVPYLEGSPVWQANRHVQLTDTTYDRCNREVQPVRLVQMDVAVVDERSPTRWVYGTFVYNGDALGDTVWDRMSPLGIQFGSDPQTFPAVPEGDSQPIRESILVEIDLYEHGGCQGRLAGPVDEQESACLTCHQGAFTTDVGGIPEDGALPSIFEFEGICYTHNAANEAYFSNYSYPDPYPSGAYPDAIPLDTSLQLWVAFDQYGQWNTARAPADPCPG